MDLNDVWKRESSYSVASGNNLPYVVLQVTLKEKLLGTGSGNLEELEEVINNQVKKGYRLHTISTSNGGSKGIGGGDRIQATLVFEKINIEDILCRINERINVNGEQAFNEWYEEDSKQNDSTTENYREMAEDSNVIYAANEKDVMFCDICGLREKKLNKVMLQTRKGPQEKKICDKCMMNSKDKLI